MTSIQIELFLWSSLLAKLFLWPTVGYPANIMGIVATRFYVHDAGYTATFSFGTTKPSNRHVHVGHMQISNATAYSKASKNWPQCQTKITFQFGSDMKLFARGKDQRWWLCFLWLKHRCLGARCWRKSDSTCLSWENRQQSDPETCELIFRSSNSKKTQAAAASPSRDACLPHMGSISAKCFSVNQQNSTFHLNALSQCITDLGQSSAMLANWFSSLFPRLRSLALQDHWWHRRNSIFF